MLCKFSLKVGNNGTLFKKWNTLYKSYPADGQYKLLYPHTKSRNTFQSNEFFRLQTGHCLLNYHSQRIGLHNSGLWDQCKVPETVPHFLFQCSKFSRPRAVLKYAVEKLGVLFDLKSVLTNSLVHSYLKVFVISCNKIL